MSHWSEQWATLIQRSHSCATGRCRSNTFSKRRSHSMHIQDQTFLVTGGSSGLGAACVRMLANTGGNVVIADVNRPAGEKLASELSTRVRFVQTDVTDETSVQNAIRVT